MKQNSLHTINSDCASQGCESAGVSVDLRASESAPRLSYCPESTGLVNQDFSVMTYLLHLLATLSSQVGWFACRYFQLPLSPSSAPNLTPLCLKCGFIKVLRHSSLFLWLLNSNFLKDFLKDGFSFYLAFMKFTETF